MSLDAEARAIVIDNGSLSIKAGFAGEDAPQCVLQTVVGRVEHKGDSQDHSGASSIITALTSHSQAIPVHQQGHFFGEDTHGKEDSVRLSRVIEYGQITSWQDLEALWHHVFDAGLHTSLREHPLLASEHPFAPKQQREKIAELAFESFNVPSFCLQNWAYLSLLSTGRETGVVVNSAESTHCVPIYSGAVLSRAYTRLDLGGEDITDYMVKILHERVNDGLASHRPLASTTTAEHKIAQEIKERLGYVAVNFEQEIQKAFDSTELDREYVLPDGKVIKVNHERIRAPEALFQVSVVGMDTGALHAYLFNAIMKCDKYIRGEMWENIVLTGGNAMFPGTVERLKKEMESLATPGHAPRINIIAPEDRVFAAWKGGSMLASSSAYRHLWISRAEYEEIGASIVHRKVP